MVLDDTALSQQNFIDERHELIFHVIPNSGDELNATLKKLLKERLGNVTLVTEEFSGKFL